MEGLSKKEVEIISNLEFEKKYFFRGNYISKFTKNKIQRYNTIKSLVKKKRIIRINRHKYYLIPIKAKTGSWSESTYIIADELCDGKDYFIGGWAAANYWRLTDQIPMRFDIYTTRRQGVKKILNANFIFHRTSAKRVKNAVSEKFLNHDFRILSKEESKEWLKQRR
jgi:predicted transcriptional regulator of viral defense system